jgi:hypothetical protein
MFAAGNNGKMIHTDSSEPRDFFIGKELLTRFDSDHFLSTFPSVCAAVQVALLSDCTKSYKKRTRISVHIETLSNFICGFGDANFDGHMRGTTLWGSSSLRRAYRKVWE